MKKWMIRIFSFLVVMLIVGYIGASIWFYNHQESFIFMNPVKLNADYTYDFATDYQEIDLPVAEDVKLSSLLFKSSIQPSSGVIFTFKGAGGNIANQNEAAAIYDSLGFDYFVMDIRGYGKSEGAYTNDQEMYKDAMAGYQQLLKLGYEEKDIILIGVSLGSGLASYVAAHKDPRQLILISPYYNIKDLAKNLTFSQQVRLLRYLPTDLLLKYNLDNASHIQNTSAPVTIFHGTADRLIYYGSSLKLQKHFKAEDRLMTIEGGIHNGFGNRPDVIEGIKQTILDLN